MSEPADPDRGQLESSRSLSNQQLRYRGSDGNISRSNQPVTDKKKLQQSDSILSWKKELYFSLLLLIISTIIACFYYKDYTIAPIPAENDTILLIWFPPPEGHKFDLNSCSSKFNIDGCYLTLDRSFYSKADGVLINHREIKSDLSNLPKEPRPFFQKWIWMNFESPQNTKKLQGLNDLFNVTLNYRRDADIVLREQIMLKTKDSGKDEISQQDPGKKDTLVCWIIRNWNKEHDRVKYYNELKKHINMNVSKTHSEKPMNYTQYKATMTRCKFYLSFENTVCHYDYMTEKLFNPLTLGSVPVVLGAPRYIYEKFVPKDAFIHVNDFSTPKELAEYLKSLDKNEEEYKKYFQWRKNFTVKHVDYPQEHVCRACQYIRAKKDYQVFLNLNKWYWDAIDDCT